ncbi:MAG: trypsin-like peptidase domain-containing protein [Planctomycetota bacterium]|nr:trypsin-like peptidase domain-containing protein [Planctomycetota bacterium]
MSQRRLLTLVAAALIAATGAVQAQDRTAALAAANALDFRQIVREAKAKVFPAVVYIRVVREATEEGKKASQQVSGSGVIITDDGHVLTNWHVVEKAQSVRCLMSDGRAMSAEVLGSDKDTDLAMLQLEVPEGAGPLPAATIGDSTVLEEGDFVMAMGAPFGLNRSVSIGIISCTRRFLSDISEYSLWLQTDAAINPGNSGGPLVNTEGAVIGINARGIGFADGMGFAIPAETISILVPQLREGEVDWSWTGLQLQPLRDFDRDIYFDETEGMVVAETDPDSPARSAGILARDRIVRLDGDPVTAMTSEDLPHVRRTFALLPKDEEATIELVRGGETHTVTLIPRKKGKVEGEEFVCERWDLTVKMINQFDNPDLHFHRKKGVFIYGLKWPGNGRDAGLREQDIILTLGREKIETLEDVEAVYEDAVDNIDQKHRMRVVVLRNGLMRQFVLDYQRDYSRE